MSGLLLLFVASIWLVICFASVNFQTLVRGPATIILFVFLVPLPFSDELFARPKYQALCAEKAVLKIEGNVTGGKEVWFDHSEMQDVSFFGLKGFIQTFKYEEKETGQPAFQYGTVTIKGGWLIRELGISETNSPLLIEGYCAPPELRNMEAWLRVNNIKKVVRPIQGK